MTEETTGDAGGQRGGAGRERSTRLDTWERIREQLRLVRVSGDDEERIRLLIELLVNLRLLGSDVSIPDRREHKGDIEKLYADLEAETRETLDSVEAPSARFIYYAREVLKKLPVRQGAEDMIEQIRAAAEAFEEERCEDDPVRGFAGDLRKEVHRRLSPRIISSYVEPYLALALRGDPEPITKAGYVALPSRFSAEDEDPSLIALAEDLLERLKYLWDYEGGDLAAVKTQLERGLGLFDRCFLKAEVLGFLELLTPERLRSTLTVMDLLKRLASIKASLKGAYGEGLIGLYDLLLLDLSLGRLIFLLANDLTNNHFAEIDPRNIREALMVVRELLNISSIKGLAIRDAQRHQAELDELIDASSRDFLRVKRSLGTICDELQRYLQADIIDAMSGVLNQTLEDYGVPTSKLSAIKTRFFNNFIRRTQIHVLSEFTEKVAAEVDAELDRQQEEGQLYGEKALDESIKDLDLGIFLATTWRAPDPRARSTLGGKGNSIVDMALLGLRVPPAFVLGYPLFGSCGADGSLPSSLVSLVYREIGELEERSGRRLGDPAHPLIVSVRSGAARSMPGVMATILNVGLSPEVRSAIGQRRGAPLPDALYRRFLENSAAALALIGQAPGTSIPNAVGTAQPAGPRSVQELEAALSESLGPEFLVDPRFQLIQAIRLVYGSRGSQAVQAYSKTLSGDAQVETAVTVQQLAYGNLNERSLSGVLITRNPITGKDELFGEFKRQAQGEEVVMGSADTEPLSSLDPAMATELGRAKTLLVSHFKQDLDLEFTVEDGKLNFLQARSAKLGAFASLVADTEFLRSGIIGLDEYRARLDRLELGRACVALPRADFRVRRWNPPLCTGVPINGGVVSGTLVLTLERLKEAEARRESVVFFAHTTKPTDFAVMNGAHAIVTIYPGRTSHAAITAMSLNKPCIVGCDDVEIDYDDLSVVFHGADSVRLREGERVTADGNTGSVYRGVAPISEFFLPIEELSEAVEQQSDPVKAADVVSSLIDAKMASLNRETSLRRLTLDKATDLDGASVLVRVDANVDLSDPSGGGRRRILQIVPTLRDLLRRGATPVVCSHLGDPGATPESRASREDLYRTFTLRGVADILASELGGRFAFHEMSVGASGLLLTRDDLVEGSVNLLENLRFATGEKDNDETFARSLAELSDGWFVNDAFNVCHRRHASITGVPGFMRHRAAGPQVARELQILETLLNQPPRPFVAVFCGADLDSHFGVMAAMLPRVDTLAIVEGVPSGSRHDAAEQRSRLAIQAMIDALRENGPKKIIVAGASSRWERGISLSRLEGAIDAANSVLWSGPVGFGVPTGGDGQAPHEAAFKRAVARGGLTVLCGKESRSIEGSATFHASSGPQAFLEYLERLSLPGITALDPAED